MAEAEVLNLADFGAAHQDIWRIGYRSDDVELFQRRLVGHGFSRLPVTGVVDVDLAGAVRVLQKHLQIDVNGVITPDLRAALDADEANGATRARAAGAEFSAPVTARGFADVSPAGRYLIPTSETPQTIQTIENVPEPIPFYKNPMVWIGVGGAILVIYFLTRREEGSEVSDVGLEGLNDEPMDDPDAFFGPPPRRRAPSRKRKPAAKRGASKKPRKPRKRKQALASTPEGPEGETGNEVEVDLAGDVGAGEGAEAEAVASPPPKKPRRRRKKKDENEAQTG